MEDYDGNVDRQIFLHRWGNLAGASSKWCAVIYSCYVYRAWLNCYNLWEVIVLPNLIVISQRAITIKKRIRKYLQKIHYLAGEQVVLLKKGSITIWNIREITGCRSILRLCWYP